MVKYRLKCGICGIDFIGRAPSTKYCDTCCPVDRRDAKAYGSWYNSTFRDVQTSIKKNQYHNLTDTGKRAHQRSNNKSRKIRRNRIRKEWGYLGSVSMESYRPSEEYARRVLKYEGYSNIIDLNDIFIQSNFDIVADANGKKIAFQVTCNTHINHITKHKRLAKAFGLEYKIIYVKPDLSGYIITTKTEISETLLREIKTL